MVNLWLLLILTILLFLILGVITKFDFLSPGMITIGTFILSELAVVYCKDVWDVHFSINAVVILFAGLLTIFFTEFLVIIYTQKRIVPKTSEQIKYISVDENVKKIVILVSILFTFILILNVYKKGSTIIGIKDISFIGAMKEDDDLNVSTFPKICHRLSRCLAFATVFLFSNNIVCSDKAKKELWLLFPVLMYCVQVFFTGGRLGIFMLVGSTFFYWIMLSRLRNGWKKIKLKKYLKPIIISAAALLIGFFLSREIVKNRANDLLFSYYIAYYLGNSTYLFSLMLGRESAVFSQNIYWGTYTFRELYNELQKYGLFENINKLKLNFTTLNLHSARLQGGNVYTIFGPPYNDFGFFGMCIYVFVLYMIICFIYYRYFKFPSNDRKILTILFVFGVYYSNIFIAFYETPTAIFKVQSILETVIMCIFISCMKRLRIKTKRK